MNATSKGPEGHDPNTIRVDLRLAWSKGAPRLVLAAVVVAAGGVLAFLDRVVEALLPMAPVAAFMAILAVSPTYDTPVKGSDGLQLPAHVGLASRFVISTYDNTRKVFRHA